MEISTLVVLFLVQVILHLNEAAPPPPPVVTPYPLQGTPTNLLVTNTGVFATIQNSLLTFNVTLFHFETFHHPEGNSNISRAVISQDRALPALICLYDGSCYFRLDRSYYYSYGDEDGYYLEEVQNVAIPEAQSSLSNVANTFYIASAGIRGSRRTIRISQFQSKFGLYENVPLTSDKRITNVNFISRNFFRNFLDGEYIYFIALDNSTDSSESGVKLMRTCFNFNTTEDELGSMFEIKVNCGPLALSSNASIVSFSKSAQTIILGLSDGLGNSAFCVFNITEVNDLITRAYERCLSGTYSFQLPWSDLRSSCAEFGQVAISECNFGNPNSLGFINQGVLAVPVTVRAANLLGFGEYSGGVTAATLVEETEGIQYLYVAFSGLSNGIIVKYHLSLEALSLRELLVYNVSSPVLLMRSGSNFVYASTNHEVMGFDVDTCSSYSDCASCTGQHDPLCGWCSLEGKCSRNLSCREHMLRDRWMQEATQCLIGNIKFVETQMTLDNLKAVELSFGALNMAFPELAPDENYFCTSVTADGRVELLAALVQSDHHTYCDLTHSNISTTDRSGKDLAIIVASDMESFSTFAVSGNLIFHNCSLNQRCSQCERIPGCGWCAYKNKCTGRSTECYTEHTWISKKNRVQRSGTLCPLVLPAPQGNYLLPVTVAENLTLITRNIPPPVRDIEYVCKFTYSDKKFVDTPTQYNNGTRIFCQVAMNQIGLSVLSRGTGVEQLELSVWTKNSSNGFMHQIEHSRMLSNGDYQFDSNSMVDESGQSDTPIPSAAMTLYNCSVFSESCSYCTGANIGSGFSCLWCSSTSAHQDRCTDLQSCSSQGNTIFINSSNQCFAAPIITSVFPSSGPTVGGTTVFINGIDLGVSAIEIEVRLGTSVCEIRPSQYMTAQQVVCTTSHSPVSGPVRITVTVKRHSDRPAIAATFAEGVEMEYVYSVPSLHGISPMHGPMSGGTHIVLKGSALNISNIALTIVRLADYTCRIQKATYSEIHCISSAVNSAVGGFVQLVIDGAHLNSLQYNYVEDPEYESLQPHAIILAGGTLVTFSGRHLNVTMEPKLVIYIGGDSYSSNKCVAENDRILKCISPRLPSFIESAYLNPLMRSRGDVRGLVLNYTLSLDAVPGPNTTDESLTLYLRSNPVFLEISVDDRQYEASSGDSISIFGRNLDSVHFSEISVTMVGEECSINFITPVELNCRPPDLPVPNNREIEIKVSIANGSLQYSVGSITYLKIDSEGQSSLFAQWMPIILGVVVLVAVTLLLLCFMGIVGIICIKKRNRLVIEHEATNPVLQGMHMEVTKPAVQCHEFEENLYEIIPDYVQFPNSQSTGNGIHVPPRYANNSIIATYPSQEEITAEPNNNISRQTISDEYVKMHSHRVSNNFTPNDVNIDDKSEGQNDTTINAEYVDMQAIDEVTKVPIINGHPPALPPSSHC